MVKDFTFNPTIYIPHIGQRQTFNPTIYTPHIGQRQTFILTNQLASNVLLFTTLL